MLYNTFSLFESRHHLGRSACCPKNSFSYFISISTNVVHVTIFHTFYFLLILTINFYRFGTKIGNEQKEWWLTRKHQYATHCFLEKGVKRYSKTLSNAAEQMNAVFKYDRGDPLLSLFHSMNEWNMKKFISRKAQANVWVSDGKPLTDYATKQHVKILEKGSRRSVSLVQLRQGEVTAKVSRTSLQHASMNLLIRPSKKKIECGCKFMNETGMICFHAAALMAHDRELNQK